MPLRQPTEIGVDLAEALDRLGAKRGLRPVAAVLQDRIRIAHELPPARLGKPQARPKPRLFWIGKD